MADEGSPLSQRGSHFHAQRASRSSTGESPSASRSRRAGSPQASGSGTRDYDIPEGWANLNELSGPSPVQNPQEQRLYRHESIEVDAERRRRSTHRATWPPPERRRSTATPAADEIEPVREQAEELERRPSMGRRWQSRPVIDDEYTLPEEYENLNEFAGPSPIENPHENELYRHRTLEEEREQSRQRRRSRALSQSQSRATQSRSESTSASRRISRFIEKSLDNLRSIAAPEAAFDEPISETEKDLEGAGLDGADQFPPGVSPSRQAASRFATQLYTISYLIFFSILGTLARLGLEWLVFYPGAPTVLPVLWANFTGSLFMGFLAEDRRLFRQEWGSNTSFNSTVNSTVEKFKTPNYNNNSNENNSNENGSETSESNDANGSPGASATAINSPEDGYNEEAMLKALAKVKKTIPLYIGLATGFCGSFTSFSSFLRDAFLALSNNLPTPSNHPYPAGFAIPAATTTVHRNGGYGLLALLAVVLTTVIMSMGALKIGAHIAIALDPLMPTLSFRLLRKALDRLVVIVAFGSWLGAVLMAVFPPDRFTSHPEVWRGEAVMACVFAPLGCLLRFYASLRLNGVSPGFPLGTFAVNIFGTAVLGMCYDLQHLSFNGIAGGSVVGCQVLEGVMDGFCGCLTTVSTWVAELNGLRRAHSYVYGMSSVVGGLAIMIVIMGSVRWSEGWVVASCAI